MNDYLDNVSERARRVLEENRVAIFIVAYNAERHFKRVLERILPTRSKEDSHVALCQALTDFGSICIQVFFIWVHCYFKGESARRIVIRANMARWRMAGESSFSKPRHILKLHPGDRPRRDTPPEAR